MVGSRNGYRNFSAEAGSLSIDQLRYQSDAWKRLISGIIEENVKVKTSLAEILKGPVDSDQLERAEKFQNSFIGEDQLIALLRKEVAEFDRLLQRDQHDKNAAAELQSKLACINDDLYETEKSFGKLKAEFIQYFSFNPISRD